MWKKGYHHPVGQDHRKSGDYIFDSDSFEVGSDFQKSDTLSNSNMMQNSNSIFNGTASPGSERNLNKNSTTQQKGSSSLSKGFFKTISSLTYNELSPKKQSAALKARLDYSEQPGVHSRSFLDRSVSDRSLTRSSSPGRRSMSSTRSSGSFSISRTPSNNIVSKLHLSKTGKANNGSRLTDSPFIDSDDDWNDTIDDIKYPKIDNATINSKDNDDEFVDIGKMSLKEVDNKPTEEVDDNYPCLKKNYQDIVKDPFSVLAIQKPPPDDVIKYNKIVKELTKSTFELTDLKKQTWGGIPSSLRALAWQILVGYLSTNKATRTSVLNRKRKEYINSITRLFRSEKDQAIWHQIKIDVLRTNPNIKLYSYETTHRSLEKILYLWAIRHPASGYVQGINDLVTPFFQVFLSHYLSSDIDINEFNPQCLPKELLNTIEADTYWCFTKVLDTIQDNFIHEQPGIIRQITELKNLMKRDEPQLASHFERENLDFIQFAFRWMNCMLMREFKLDLIIRMWDTYLSDFPIGFSQFHIYVCCAFLRRFSDHLLEMEFQDIIMFLQDTSKTEDWTDDDIEMMLSEAYVWQSLYENASAHLK